MDKASGRKDDLGGVDRRGLGQAPPEALRMALCAVSEPVFVVDTRQDRIVEANPSACLLVGLSMAEIRRIPAGDALAQIGLCDIPSQRGPKTEQAALASGSVPKRPDSADALPWRVITPLHSGDGVLVIVGRPVRSERDGRPEHARSDIVRPLRMDPLTGLPDRAAFEEQLVERCVSNARSRLVNFAVLFIDLDGFKQVNDQLGHRHGDGLLRTVAQQLRRAVRPDDLVARFGGDEFTVLLDAVHGINDAIGVAQRLLAATESYAKATRRGNAISVSVGIALGRAGMNPADLIDAADRAMYRAKEAGGGTWAVAEGDSPS